MYAQGRQTMANAPVRDGDRAFLNVLLVRRRASRADVAEVAGISKPTASETAARLLRAGIIRESGPAQGRRGRAPQLYEIEPTFGLGMSVVARADALELSAVDFSGELMDRSSLRLDPRTSPSEFWEVLSTEAHQLLANLRAPCRGTAVSLAAPVDPHNRRSVRLQEAPFPAADLDVVSVLQPLTTGRVEVDNDVNWTALATCAEEDLRDGLVLHVHLGTGLGAALTIDGSIVHGRRGALGEIGRFRAEGRSVTQRLGALGVLGTGGHYIDIETSQALMLEQSEHAESLRRTIAEAVSNAVVMVDPDHVVFSGPLVEPRASLDTLVPHIKQALDDAAMPRHSLSTLGASAAAVGTRIAARELLHESAWRALNNA